MKAVRAVTSNCSARRGRARQVKEYAGIRPFLKPRKTRHEYGYGPQHFPKSQDGEEIQWVAKDGDDAMGIAQILSYLRNTAASDRKRYENGRSPIDDDSCFHGQSNLPTTSSSLPIKLCHPYFAPL